MDYVDKSLGDILTRRVIYILSDQHGKVEVRRYDMSRYHDVTAKTEAVTFQGVAGRFPTGYM
jgi:hypothetical protein